MSFLILLFASLTAFAETAPAVVEIPPHAPRLSHNLSATTNMLESGQCTAGLQLVACGLSDRVSVGSSVWLWSSYRMINASARFKLADTPDGGRWALQAYYFKTLKNPYKTFENRYYDMEAVWLVTMRSFQLAPHYRLHFNLHTNYYKTDKMPFSMRRPIPRRTDLQMNFTTLHEVDLVNGWFIFGEIGALDFTQPIQYIHSGASIGRSTKNWSWHAGFSVTGTLRALFSPTHRADYQQLLRLTEDGFDQPLDAQMAKFDYGMHPEFSLQYFF